MNMPALKAMLVYLCLCISWKVHVVVSQNRRTPIQTLIYYNPYYRDPQNGAPNFWKLPCIDFHVWCYGWGSVAQNFAASRASAFGLSFVCPLLVLGVLGDLCFWIADFKCCASEVDWGEGVLIGTFWLNQFSRSVPSHLASRTARYEGK